MKMLQASDFVAFFGELYKDANDKPIEPFPWQRKLAERVIAGDWPQGIALPTASGKTACIDIALFALACQADQPPQERTAPRRIFFVVDRRIIVDEAYERSRKLVEKLRAARSDVLGAVAERLRILAGGDDPLACFQLRGGMYRDDAWARTPTQPTVIASTVDQIGSRLLHRGYGVSPYSWSIHAGLAANDSLIILDEAHCAQPFMQTLQAVDRYRGWADRPLKSPFHVVVMSATPPEDIQDVIMVDETDRRHPVLAPRLKASKLTGLEVAKIAKGGDALKHLAEKLVEQALNVAGDTPKAVAVIVNRVATAKEVYRQLKEHKAIKDQADVDLFIGRMRPIDRDDAMTASLHKLDAARSKDRQLERSHFVVATQCLEVGANLDFDAMVSECASLDALRQRFGRLNRMGRCIEARGMIVIRADQVNSKDEDPIYGPALSNTWAWLQQHKQDESIDFGVAALEAMLPADPQERQILLAGLVAPSADAPVMLPAHVDCWTQTYPEPCPSPDVSLFLHGPRRNSPEVQVCWRADLTPRRQGNDRQEPETRQGREERWIETVTLCPPSIIECMAVPLHVLKRWWTSSKETSSLADIEGPEDKTDVEPSDSKSTDLSREGLRWRGPDDDDTGLIEDANDVRPGYTIILPASLGGWKALGHIPSSEKADFAVDVGDRAHQSSRRWAVLRIAPPITESWPDCPAKQQLLELVAQRDAEETEIQELLAQLAENPNCMPWLTNAANALARDSKLQVFRHPSFPDGVVLRGSHRLSVEELHVDGLDINASNNENYTSEDDGASAMVRVSLPDHLRCMAKKAAEFARQCGLSEEFTRDLMLAGDLHDLGKADQREQVFLHRSVQSAWAGPLLAKSDHRLRRGDPTLRHLEKFLPPRGWRHELLSMQLAETQACPMASAHDRELVLHLIASHHGRCRPFAPVVPDDQPQLVEVPFYGSPLRLTAEQRAALIPPYRLDSGVPERFWILVRRYGWWGLAYLEAILRLADHRTSEAEQTEHEKYARTPQEAMEGVA